jgi:hypothetical protein
MTCRGSASASAVALLSAVHDKPWRVAFCRFYIYTPSFPSTSISEHFGSSWELPEKKWCQQPPGRSTAASATLLRDRQHKVPHQSYRYGWQKTDKSSTPTNRTALTQSFTQHSVITFLNRVDLGNRTPPCFVRSYTRRPALNRVPQIVFPRFHNLPGCQRAKTACTVTRVLCHPVWFNVARCVLRQELSCMSYRGTNTKEAPSGWQLRRTMKP